MPISSEKLMLKILQT